jgi:hypothetical protein
VIVTNEEIAQIITAQKALDALKEKKDLYFFDNACTFAFTAIIFCCFSSSLVCFFSASVIEAKQAVAPAGTTVIVTNEEIAQIITAQKALDALKVVLPFLTP